MNERTLRVSRQTRARLAVAAVLALLVFLVLGLAPFAGPAGAIPCDPIRNPDCGEPGDPPAPVTYFVTNTNDSGPGSLRQAITSANGAAGAQVINFEIPGEGVHTIAPLSALPAITDPVTIDGYTQPGARPNTLNKGNDAVLKIELDGEYVGWSSGLEIQNSKDSKVRGLVINRFRLMGIRMGPLYSGGSGNVVQGNFIGTDATGTQKLRNGYDGVHIEGNDNVVGGTQPAARNVVSGNGAGVYAYGYRNQVQGNYIGTTADGSGALGNAQQGVILLGENTVGGSADGAGNVIAFNGAAGVEVAYWAKNVILSNVIHSNGGLGIDLVSVDSSSRGVTPNDPGDGDVGSDPYRAGGNNFQNYPEITSITTRWGYLEEMRGKLNSTPNTTFTVQFFTGNEPDPSGYGEGQIYGWPNNTIGGWEVTTDANGDASLDHVWPSWFGHIDGKWLTATATGPDGTSEFSKAVRIKDLADPAPETKIDSGPSGFVKETTATFAFSSNEPNSTFECSLDGAAFTGCTSPKGYAGLSQGEHTFGVRATDDAGNPDPTPETRSFTVDTTSPNTSISSGPAQGSTTKITSASFTFVASEPVSRFECSLDSSAFAPCASPKGYSGLTNRVHTFQVRAVDRAGNVDPTTAMRTWTVDTTLPVVGSPSPVPSSVTTDRTPLIAATAKDAQTNLLKGNVQLFVDGRTVSAFAYSATTDRLTYTPSLQAGYHTAKVAARDAAGNIATKTWGFTVK